MNRLILGAFSLCVTLTACAPDPDNQQGGGQQNLLHKEMFAPSAERAATNQSLRAISHNFVLRLPASAVESALNRVSEACLKAGGSILSLQLARLDDGRINGSLSLRIAPAGLDPLVGLLAAPPASLLSHAESAEDKTLAVLDVEKRLEIKRALRDRLQAMLKDPAKASVADLIAIEKELSSVQSDIETATAQQAYLRSQTDLIRVDISLQGVAAAAGGVDLTPIHNAWHNIGRTVAQSAASVISFLAALLPWLPVIAVALWGAMRLVRRWRRSRPNAG